MMINLRNIVLAEDHYLALGYKKMDVPWIIPDEPYHITKPIQAGKDFATIGGNLVASGEQSFLHLMLDGANIKKAQCTTPCFRDEAVYDELHHPYFMKTEIIDTNISNLNQVLEHAQDFFNAFMDDVELLEIGKDMVDIVDSRFKIELGSYGIRQYKDFKWIYGTGCAEPRFTQVLDKYYK